MTPAIVLDASAAVHLVLGAEHAGNLAEALDQSVSVTAPDLFFSEVGNGLWKYIQHGTLPLEEAVTRLEEAMGLVDGIVPSQDLIHEAVIAAVRYKHPVYDMVYAVLARRYGAQVLTMDRPFASLLRQMEIDVYCPIA
ncbi:MAG TPA: type II toxin-antitoxin system VapC family toxin [Thermoanaerobaculia bacterium]